MGGFGFVLLISLRRNFDWGKEPMAALRQGRGLPMNVRLISPATGDVQCAGHGLSERGRPSNLKMFLNKVDTTEQGMY